MILPRSMQQVETSLDLIGGLLRVDNRQIIEGRAGNSC